MCTHDMNSRGGGTGFDATDMDAPSSQLIAFVNLDSHSQHFDDSLFTHTTFLSLPLCCIIYLFGTTLSYCLQLYVMPYAIVVSCSPVVIGGGSAPVVCRITSIGTAVTTSRKGEASEALATTPPNTTTGSILVARRPSDCETLHLMNLARHSISSTSPIQILDARFDPDCRIFTSATPAGFAVYQTWPLKLLRKRGRPTQADPFTP